MYWFWGSDCKKLYKFFAYCKMDIYIIMIC